MAWCAPAEVEAPDRRGVAAFGLIVVNHISTKCSMELWPENFRVWNLFCEIRNQWRRAGFSGAAYALDYGVLFTRMDRMRLSDREYEETFDLIRHMERKALEEMNRDADD